MAKRFNEINDQLTDQGLYIKSGGVSMINASVIEAQLWWPNKDKEGQSSQDLQAQCKVRAASNAKHKSTYGHL